MVDPPEVLVGLDWVLDFQVEQISVVGFVATVVVSVVENSVV